jgi:hypothetical protein
VRVDLPDGSWAELRERPTHGQVNVVRRALLRAGVEAEEAATVAQAYVACYVSAWSVKNSEGNEVPLERIEDAPDDVVQAFAAEAKKLYTAKPDPKGSRPPGRPTRRQAARA